MNGVLFKRELKSNYKIILIFLAVLSMYGSMIVAMFDPRMGESLQEMLDSMPQVFAAFGMASIANTLTEFIVNYLYGFLLIIFPSIFIILTSSRVMGRYISKGSMAYLLATPNTRRKIAVTQGLFLLTGVIVLVSYITILCIIVSQSLFPGDLKIKEFIAVNLGLLGYHVLISGICFFSSCTFTETKIPTSISGGMIVAFVLLQSIANVGDKFAFLKYCTPLTLFNTDELLALDAQGIYKVIILYVLGIVFFVAGIISFEKRDLSI